MRRRIPAALIGALAGACVLLAGCSGSGVNAETLDPPATTTSAPLAASSSAPVSAVPPGSAVASPSNVASASGGVADVEAADRAAIESQWIESWDVYMEIARTPKAEREALVTTIAVDPARANMLKDAAKFDSQGLETYGELGHRISWPQPVGGRTFAVIDDCQDRSHSGSRKTATGDKVTVGVARDHYQGRLVKGEDGVWRVEQVFYLKEEPC
ncbi:hypothetical protein ACVBEQ_27535 [Nakamurella sp. GG22]